MRPYRHCAFLSVFKVSNYPYFHLFFLCLCPLKAVAKADEVERLRASEISKVKQTPHQTMSEIYKYTHRIESEIFANSFVNHHED